MDTSTAATKAKVTVATIRTWCRIGAVAAHKAGGRWVIDAASLRARITLGKAMRKAARQRKADAGRARILAALHLPELTGSPKQIAWAQTLRAERIARALTAHVKVRGEIVYRLKGVYDDMLGVNYIPGVSVEHFTEEGALTDLQTAVTHGRRGTAAWWIDNRDATAPMG